MGKKRTLIKKILLWFGTLCCVVMIFTLSSQPAPVSNSVSEAVVEKSSEVASQIAPSVSNTGRAKKILTNKFFRDFAHVMVFSLFSFFLTLSIRQYNLRYMYLISFVISVLYGVVDEVYQFFFAEGRSLEFGDILKDWCGSISVILLIMGFFYVVKVVRLKKQNRGSV